MRLAMGFLVVSMLGCSLNGRSNRSSAVLEEKADDGAAASKESVQDMYLGRGDYVFRMPEHMELVSYNSGAGDADAKIHVRTKSEIWRKHAVKVEDMILTEYDADPEFSRDKTAFFKLCREDVEAIQLVPNVRLALDFWGNAVHTTAYTCISLLEAKKADGTSDLIYHRIAAFFIAEADVVSIGPVVDMYDAEASYGMPHLIEATYIMRANTLQAFDAAVFARRAQQSLVTSLYRTHDISR